jgi:Lrp/AsnC family transcriptional regulator
MEESVHQGIDRLDVRLLDILQREGALSVAEVAARARISTTTCWRRVQQLERDGVIKARVALLDRNALGLDLTIFAHVKLATTGRDALAEFEAAIRDRGEVLECYTLTGEWDFLLKIVTRNVKAYEAFYLDYLSRIPCVRSVNSSVAVTVIKESTALPLAAR